MTFENTALALAEYDKGKPAREAAFWDAPDDAAQFAAEEEEEIARRKVREAFFEDTQEINSRLACDVVGLDFCREMVARDKERKKEGGQRAEGASGPAVEGL